MMNDKTKCNLTLRALNYISFTRAQKAITYLITTYSNFYSLEERDYHVCDLVACKGSLVTNFREFVYLALIEMLCYLYMSL